MENELLLIVTSLDLRKSVFEITIGRGKYFTPTSSKDHESI